MAMENKGDGGKRMTMNVLGYAAQSAKAALAPYRFVRRDPSGTVAQDEIFYPWGERWDYAGTLYDERFASLGCRGGENQRFERRDFRLPNSS
jgi:hypothetical protein